MRFTVVTYGTEGDTRPLVALCRGLIEAGHNVHLFADRSTLSTAMLLGVASTPLAGDIREAAEPDAALSKLMKDGSGVQRMTRAVATIANANTAAWMECVLKDARSSDAILFSGIASYIGLSVGECLNIPAIGLGLLADLANERVRLTPAKALADARVAQPSQSPRCEPAIVATLP